MDDWLSLGATVLGGLLGGSAGSNGGGTTTTSTNAADPRFNQYLYGTGGVLPSASNWYQNNSTGLNEQSLAGLNRQYAVASDPNTAQGYTNMQSLGSSLMGGAVAGNPFTDGRMGTLGKNLGQTQQPTMGGMSFNNPAAGGPGFNGGGAGAFTQPTYQTQNAAPPTLQDLIKQIGGGAGINFGSGGGSGGDNMGSGVSGGLGGLGGFSMHDLASGLLDNQNAVNAIAGGVFGPAGGLISRGLMGLLGAMPAGLDGTGESSPNSVGGIHNYGSMNDARQNEAISTSMNQAGMGGWGGSPGGGFSGYGGGGYGGYGAGDPDGF